MCSESRFLPFTTHLAHSARSATALEPSARSPVNNVSSKKCSGNSAWHVLQRIISADDHFLPSPVQLLQYNGSSCKASHACCISRLKHFFARMTLQLSHGMTASDCFHFSFWCMHRTHTRSWPFEMSVFQISSILIRDVKAESGFRTSTPLLSSVHIRQGSSIQKGHFSFEARSSAPSSFLQSTRFHSALASPRVMRFASTSRSR